MITVQSGLRGRNEATKYILTVAYPSPTEGTRAISTSCSTRCREGRGRWQQYC